MGARHQVLLQARLAHRHHPLWVQADFSGCDAGGRTGHRYRRHHGMRNHRSGRVGRKGIKDRPQHRPSYLLRKRHMRSAAVLGVDGAIRPKPYKTAVAVATVVIFGTVSMFLYPILYRAGVFQLSPEMMGLFTGATVHEVAHVVGASNAMGPEVSNIAIIVKMIRVMMLVPVLLVIAWTVAKSVNKQSASEDGNSGKTQITIPWFAVLFLVVIGFNSLNLLPESVVRWINQLDTFLLTMAMTALGAETSIDKFKKAGFKPFLLAAILYCWLIGGGYCLIRFALPSVLQ